MKKLVALSLLAVAACAEAPEKIAPIDAGISYSKNSCSQTRTLMQQEEEKLADLSEQQRRAATNDTVGVLLIGVPVSSLSGGDLAGQIGVSKGKLEAMKLRLSRC